MPYLLGAFGVHYNSDQIKKLSNIALQQAAEGTLQTMPIENGIIFAGYKHDEKYHLMTLYKCLTMQGILVGKLFDRSNYDKVNFDKEMSLKTC